MAEAAAYFTLLPREGPLANGVKNGIAKGIQGAASEFRTFERELDRANRRVVAFGASAAIIYGSVRAFRDLVKVTVDVEKQLASINSIFNLTQRQLDGFSRQLFNTAKLTAQSFSDVARAAEEFSRQGLGVEETAKRTRDALILVRLTGLDAGKAVDLLTAAMNTFGKTGADTTTIINKLVAVDQKFAVSAKDIAEAIARSASVIDDANVTLDQFNGLVTAARQITSREGSVIGNSLKTIFTRLERSTTLDQLEALGVSVRDASGNAKNALDIFNSVAQAYKTLNREQQTQVAELGAGVFQINQFKALLLDLGKANGIAAQATRESVNATDEALVRNAALNKTLEASFKTLQASATQAASVVGNLTLKPLASGFLTNANLGIEGFFGSLRSSGDTKAAEDFGAYLGESILKGLGNLISGPGFIAALKLFGSLSGKIGRELITDTRSTLKGFSLGDKLQSRGDQSALQEVNKLLNQATSAEQARFRAAKTLADQEREVLAILERQIAAQARLANLSFPIVGGRVVQTPVQPSQVIPRRRNAAGGYIPEAMGAERAAISAGVGGAPSSARAVLIPSFRFGGGKVGPLVANTSEYKVPNLAGGGDGIFNQSMIRKYGLPPGATPVAAGGYVPNAAGGFRDYPEYSPYSSQDYQRYIRGDFTQTNPTVLSQIDKAFAQRRKEQELQKQKEIEQAYKLLDKEKALSAAKRQLTEQEIATGEKASAAIQKIYQSARARASQFNIGREATELPSTYYANRALAGFGNVLQYGPPSPSAQMLSVRNAPITGAGAAGNPANVLAQQNAATLAETRAAYASKSVPVDLLAQGNTNTIFDAYGRPVATGTKTPLAQYLSGSDRVKKSFERAEKQREAYDRLSRRSNNIQFGLLGASFLSAGLPEGTSGQASGQLFGALGRGAEGAATGSVVGSFFGPKGTIAGAGIGGLIGAIKGFIDRSTKSFEELAREIEEANSKSAQSLEAASQFLNIQGNIQEAVERGRGQDVINSLLEQQRNISKNISPSVLRQLVDAGFSQEAQSDVLRTLSAGDTRIRQRGLLAKSFDLIGEDKTTPDVLTAQAAFVKRSLGAGAGTNISSLLGRIKEAESALIAPGTVGQGAASVQAFPDILRKQIEEELTGLINASELTDTEKKDRIQRIKKVKTDQLINFLKAFERAAPESKLVEESQKGARELSSLRTPLQELLRTRGAALESLATQGGAANRIASLRENATLEFGDLSERARLTASGGFALASARREANLSNTVAFETARSEFARELGGKISQEQVSQIFKASGIEDLQKIIANFNSKEVKDKLDEVVREVARTVEQNDVQIALVQEQNRIEQLLLDSQQQQRLLSAGTFGRDTRTTSANLFSRIGTSFGASRRAEGIELGNFLTQLGIPQTDVGAAFDRDLRAKSVKDNLAALLSGRLGTRVGSSRSSLEAATGQLGGQFGDQALASRVKEALRSLDFDPVAARKQLLEGDTSKSTLEALANRGELQAGTLVLKTSLDSIDKLTKGSQDILKRIEANLRQQSDIAQRTALSLQSLSLDQKLNDTNLSPRQLADAANKKAEVDKQIKEINTRLANPEEYMSAIDAANQRALEKAREEAPKIGEEIGIEAGKAFIVSASEVQGTSLENYLKSFSTGFTGGLEDSIKGPFSSIEQAMLNLQDVGAKVGASLEANLGDAFGDFIVGASRGKDAFRAFALGVLNDAARAFASKAVQSLLGYALGALGSSATSGSTNFGFIGATGGNFRGGPIGFANGGAVPVALTGGEFVFSPSATKNLGVSTVSAINAGTFQKRAGGGSIVRGGSGVRDDVFGTAPAGSFVIRKAMVERYGGGFLSSLASSASSGASFSLNTTPYADGGPVASITTPSPMMVAAGGGAGGGVFNIGVTINDNSTSSTSSSSGGGQPMDRQFGEILTMRIKQITMQTIEEQQRAGGVLRSTARRT